MANPVCTRESLTDASGCFSGQVLPKNTQKALKIYFMAAQLAAIGGTDYRTALHTTLLDDVKCYNTMSLNQFDKAALVIEYNNANGAGAALGSNFTVFMAAIACLMDASPIQLKSAELFLRCQLGYGDAYPQ